MHTRLRNWLKFMGTKRHNNWMSCMILDFLLYCCSVAKLCLTLCNPMDCSMPGFPVHHQLLELPQTHVHRVGDAIQPSHPLSSPFPPAFNLSQHQGLFQWVSSCIRWPKYWRFSYSISPSNEYSGLISLGLFCWFCRIVLLFCLV